MAADCPDRTDRSAPWALIGFIIVLSLALVAAAVSYYRVQRARIVADATLMLQSIADLKVQQVVAWRNEQREEANYLFDNKTFARSFAGMLAGDAQARIEVEDWLTPIREENPDWSYLTLLDPQLRQRFDYGKLGDPLLGSRGREHALAAAANHSILFTELHRRNPDDPAHIDLVIPIADENDIGVGLIFVRIDLSVALFPILRDMPTSTRTAEVLLVSDDGDTVSYLDEMRHYQGMAAEPLLPLTREDLAGAAAVRGGPGPFVGRDYHGMPVVAILKPVPESTWRLVARIDMEEIEAPLRPLMAKTAAVAALFLLASVGMLGMFWERQRRLEASRLLEIKSAGLALASRYAALMLNANDGILLADERLRIIDVNARLEELTGFSRQELLEMSVSDLRTPEARADLESTLERVRRSDGGIYETVHQRKGGTIYPVEVSVRFVEEGDRRLLLAHLRDISERRHAEDQVRQLNAELEQRVAARTAALAEANRELESFSYSVSHDLRAPLRAIDGFSRILLEEYAPTLDGEGRRLLDVVSANARRMAHLIDDLLAFSRLGRADLHSGSVDMGALAREAFEELCPQEARARVRLELGPLPGCLGDAALLRQVWANLVGNALKFTSKLEYARIEIAGEQRGEEIVYHVRDNGVGFDMVYAEKLFGVFQRLHGPEQFEGTGVGLAIVQRIVRRHGGRVWADGTPAGGATFSFALPAGGSHGGTGGG